MTSRHYRAARMHCRLVFDCRLPSRDLEQTRYETYGASKSTGSLILHFAGQVMVQVGPSDYISQDQERDCAGPWKRPVHLVDAGRISCAVTTTDPELDPPGSDASIGTLGVPQDGGRRPGRRRTHGTYPRR
jgi:hypothetical protein